MSSTKCTDQALVSAAIYYYRYLLCLLVSVLFLHCLLLGFKNPSNKVIWSCPRLSTRQSDDVLAKASFMPRDNF